MGMLFGGYGAQGVKIKRVKGVYVMTRKRIAVLTAQADEYTQGRFLSGFFEKAFQLDYDVCVFSMYLKYQDTASREVGDANIFNLIEFDKYDGRKGISVCRRMKNSLSPVFFPPTALFPMLFLHSAAKERRTPAVFPGRKADFPTMRIFSAAASVLTLHRRS